MSALLTHVLPVLFCTAVVAFGVVIGAAQTASTITKARRRAAGLAPARHARNATPIDHARTIRRALAAGRIAVLDGLRPQRSDERLAQVAGGTR
ncbi:hypothetical protein [Kineosporia sp. R_H_3]|uniref:hypothetical protein n=1 Tax=Kineosporia sp. R_H_3 TaxID=1961848 RepID=UPI000B4AE975|nr:hypothetical protein [Kineosporia sp. R_H_3]